jgi:hypothetical protein
MRISPPLLVLVNFPEAKCSDTLSVPVPAMSGRLLSLRSRAKTTLFINASLCSMFHGCFQQQSAGASPREVCSAVVRFPQKAMRKNTDQNTTSAHHDRLRKYGQRCRPACAPTEISRGARPQSTSAERDHGSMGKKEASSAAFSLENKEGAGKTSCQPRFSQSLGRNKSESDPAMLFSETFHVRLLMPRPIFSGW